MTQPLAILLVLSACVALAEWLGRRRYFSHVGSALLVIVITAVAANLGVIPTAVAPRPIYDVIFGTIAPLGVFWLLLDVDIARIRRAGGPILAAFGLGAIGTVVGVVAGMAVVDGEQSIGPGFRALGGMFVGTYTGGSVNFSAVAIGLGVETTGVLFAGATVVDCVMTTVWMLVTLAVPVAMRRLGGVEGPAKPPAPAVAIGEPGANGGTSREGGEPAVFDVALLIALALGSFELARAVPAAFDGQWMLVHTTFALVAAHVPSVRRLRGNRMLGLTALLYFLALIGALCDLEALRSLGRLGTTLFLFVAVCLLVHGVIVFGGSRLLHLHPDVAAVASQANIGGGTTALALAQSLRRDDLELPAVLVGALGTATGTYLGFWTAQALL